MIEVLTAGAHSRVEGGGRRGRAHLGHSLGGAADMRALALANAAVGNALEASALEVTLAGPTLRAHTDVVIAWCGGDWDVLLDEVRVPALTPMLVRAGQTLRCGSCRTGVRAVVAFAGGIIDPAPGTAVRHHGTSLVFGPARGAAPPISAELACEHAALGESARIRVTDGTHASWFTTQAHAEFVGGSFTVSADASRRGVRLFGPRLERLNPREPVSEGVSAGSVQVTHAGDPIVLHVDQTTTGGYAKIAHVIGADLWRVGQLRPGSRVCFVRVSLDEARRALLEWHTVLDSLR